ncbi:transposase (plasmid) [Sphingobium cloacae]|uniref:Transposase n=1 Tax=Sphingobium cloacae TaxID=120107 RepID=A0A1E1F853_9SPHN|nr:transposase [Sphingobium cloacae]
MPLAALWGDGTTSSSDGQQFHAGGRGAAIGDINARSGNEPGVAFYTHVSDRYDPFASRVIAATAGEAPYVLDGLLYHQSGLTIEEHYTDTGGASDHVFGLMPFFGYRFAPRLRDIKDRRLHLLSGQEAGSLLAGMTGDPIAMAHVGDHWDELLRFATSIRTGTVTASAMLRRLSAYPRQNGLALALRELGRLERSIFMLDWLRDIDLRRRTQAGLNKGEARNALARALFLAQSARSCDFGHLGEHVGNGLVVVDDRPCEERRSAPIRERRYEPWRFEWGSDRLLEPEFFGHRVRDRQSGDGTTGIGGSA